MNGFTKKCSFAYCKFKKTTSTTSVKKKTTKNKLDMYTNLNKLKTESKHRKKTNS